MTEAKKIRKTQWVGPLFKVLASVLLVLTPIFAMWLSSSLAAYANGPKSLAIGVALLLCPVLPLAWEYWSFRRFSRKKNPRPRILTFLDRVTLRTLFLAFLVLGGVFGIARDVALRALATRGDWFLDGVDASWADSSRHAVHAVSDTLMWAYDLREENPYERPQDAPGPNARPPEAQPHSRTADSRGTESSDSRAVDPRVPTPPSDRDPSSHTNRPSWPWPNQIHPMVAQIPNEAEGTIEGVVNFIASHAQSDLERARLVHDYIASRVAYDTQALAQYRSMGHYDGQQYPQSAEAVFARRIGVCAGYAALFEAMVQQLGLGVAYVTGDSKAGIDEADGQPHAWNAVQVDGEWFLVDVTWDAGSVGPSGFSAQYRADYFLTPPEVFGVSHFPDDARWQLRSTPINRAEFFRQPALAATFFARGWRLINPLRAQVDAARTFSIELDNRGGRFALVQLSPHGQSPTAGAGRCDVTSIPEGDVTHHRAICRATEPGRYGVWLFDGGERFGSYQSVGTLLVNVH